MPSHTPRLLITAGPTHEPIDAVRFLGNRSSGRLGVALADEAARRGWPTTLLLGPAPASPTHEGVRLHRFRTCSDLQTLLREHVPAADILVMAAAVADYRPKVDPAVFNNKFRRTSEPLKLELEPTPDLLAEVARTRRKDQMMVGFALEPQAELETSARAKLERKRIDMVVGNPLDTMDSPTITAMVLFTDGERIDTPGAMDKTAFAPWLLKIIADRYSPFRAHAST